MSLVSTVKASVALMVEIDAIIGVYLVIFS
jgi:hypothetical protein